MAKQIVWTETAVQDRLRIYQFWYLHNQSFAYSDKLESLFNESARIISIFPEIGKVTEYENIRVKIIGDFKLFYEINHDVIEIIRVWDTRQDPENLY